MAHFVEKLYKCRSFELCKEIGGIKSGLFVRIFTDLYFNFFENTCTGNLPIRLRTR